jgi:hypothetical protein
MQTVISFKTDTNGMKMPKLATTIDRRLFITYRLNPELLKPILPEGLEPDIINGYAVAGICLIRLKNMRPQWFTPELGITVENVAHRIAIKYVDDQGETHSGVYIPERHTSSELAAGVGSAALPGIYKKGSFEVHETDKNFNIHMKGKELAVDIDASLTENWESQLFDTAEAASNFYRYAPIAISPAPKGHKFETLELATETWAVDKVQVNKLVATFYDAMPQSEIAFDHALVMRNIRATWGSAKNKEPAMANKSQLQTVN